MPSLLSSFPPEILQLIALWLPSHKEVLAFASVSRRLYSAICDDQYVFRKLFLQHFEPPRDPAGYQYKRKFKQRFTLGHGDEEFVRDMIAWDMIADARPTRQSPDDVSSSCNLDFLAESYRRWGHEVNREISLLLQPLLLDTPKEVTPEREYNMSLPWISIHRKDVLRIFASEEPCGHEIIPATHLFAISSLVQAHLNTNVKGTILQAKVLQKCQLPCLWEGDIRSAPLGCRWIGAYLTISSLASYHSLGTHPTANYHYGGLYEIMLDFESPVVPTTFTGVGKSEAQSVFRVCDGAGWSVVDDDGEEQQRVVFFIAGGAPFSLRYDGVLLRGNHCMLGFFREENMSSAEQAAAREVRIFMHWRVQDDTDVLAWNPPTV